MSQKKKNVSRKCLPYLRISYAKQPFEADPELAVLNFLGFRKKTGCWCSVHTFFLHWDEKKQEVWGGRRLLTVKLAKWRCWWKSNVSICSTALVSTAVRKRGPSRFRGPAINLTGQQRPNWGLCYDLITLSIAQVVIWIVTGMWAWKNKRFLKLLPSVT